MPRRCLLIKWKRSDRNTFGEQKNVFARRTGIINDDNYRINLAARRRERRLRSEIRCAALAGGAGRHDAVWHVELPFQRSVIEHAIIADRLHAPGNAPSALNVYRRISCRVFNRLSRCERHEATYGIGNRRCHASSLAVFDSGEAGDALDEAAYRFSST